MYRPSLFQDILDLLMPRPCANCGRRLTAGEQTLCVGCLLQLPRVQLEPTFDDNSLARLFWGCFPVGRATAFIYHQPQASSSRFIYRMKYEDQPIIARQMGALMAKDLLTKGFFEGIDVLIPVPLSRKRQRQRGYNQSLEIARGVAEVTALPVCHHIVGRIHFKGSQTHLSAIDRRENVEGAFRLTPSHWWQRKETIEGRHVLLIDDVVTTGATLMACAQELMKAKPRQISILALAYTRSQ